ncbi:MAG TPA: S41 family peptidase [Bryobacteraceae bacterium]|nr:S41 family peptidase [Bryobacteraceae bacterium]
MLFLPFLLFLAADEPANDPGAILAREMKKVVDVFVAADQNAAEPVSSEVLFYQGAIPGMLRTLDPHSIFFDPGQYEQLQQMEKSETKGFGTIVSVLPGRVIVLQAAPGTPSSKAGLSAGDEILGINGYTLSRLDFDQLVELLTEARQREAILEVRKPGNPGIVRMTMTPQIVNAPSVDRAFLLAPGIGYVRVTSFEVATGKLVADTLDKLGGDNLKGLVLDLRGNPGGVVTAAAETAALFLKPDQLVFTIKGRAQKTEDVNTPAASKPYKFPLVVLIDGKSASASEILTGALQDHDRATVLGEPSYGKGLVQNVYPLANGTGVALTIAFYYTPSGRSIQHPLHGGTLDTTTSGFSGTYKTDSGREVHGGGGIQPDQVIYPPQQDRLSMVLDASGVITSFASEYLQQHQIHDDFEVTPAIIGALQAYLTDRNIQPGVSEWSAHRPWIESRLQQEIMTLSFGVSKGDQIELQRDPVVKRALEILAQSPK